MPRRRTLYRFLKPLETNSLPAHVVALACSVSIPPDRPGQAHYDFSLKAWFAVHRIRRVGRSDLLRRSSGIDASSFWLWLQGIARADRRVWIICPDAGEIFRVLCGWEYSDSGLISWGNLTAEDRPSRTAPEREKLRHDCTMVLSGACTILTHRIGQGRCTWVSTSNYLELDLPAWSDAVGKNYPAAVDLGPGGSSFQSDPETASAVIDEYFAKLMAEYSRDGGGHWRPTAAQLAHQTWRKSHYTHPILEHKDETIHKLERSALFGGRAEVNFYGTVGAPPGSLPGESSGPEPASSDVLDGPLYQYDVRSQYPSFLATRNFPMAYQRTIHRPSLKELESLCRHACAIARVDIQTPSPDYPYRLGGDVSVRTETDGSRFKRSQSRKERSVCYPVGDFHATLCGPELLHALTRGRVIRCSVAAVYSSGPAFKSFGESMIARRSDCKKSLDASGETLAKLLANSFVGKFAAKGGGWRTVKGYPPPEPWGEWQEIDATTEEVISWRSLSGVSQRWEPTPDEPCGIPSIFAYCTSYGRVQMLDMIHTAGNGGWVWCHTDGIVLTPEGLRKLSSSSLPTSGKTGHWRACGEISRCRAWGPSHYFADGLWTLSGWSEGTWLDSRGTVYDWRKDEVSRIIAERGSPSVHFTLRRSRLEAAVPQGAIGPDGWAVPPTLRAGEREPRFIPD